MPLREPAAWIIAYDIRAQRRSARVRKAVLKVAVPVQYSLYMALASQNQINALATALATVIDPEEDDLRIYRVPDNPDYRILGRQRCQLPMVLPARFPEGVRRFSRDLFNFPGNGAQAAAGGGNLSPLSEILHELECVDVSCSNK